MLLLSPFYNCNFHIHTILKTIFRANMTHVPYFYLCYLGIEWIANDFV